MSQNMSQKRREHLANTEAKGSGGPRHDDLLWKDLLARFFVPMLRSLLPDLAKNIDDKRDVVFLDKELRRLARFTRRPEESRTRTASSISWRMFLSAPAKTLGSSSTWRCKAGAETRTFPSGCTVTGGCWRDATEGL